MGNGEIIEFTPQIFQVKSFRKAEKEIREKVFQNVSVLTYEDRDGRECEAIFNLNQVFVDKKKQILKTVDESVSTLSELSKSRSFVALIVNKNDSTGNEKWATKVWAGDEPKNDSVPIDRFVFVLKTYFESLYL